MNKINWSEYNNKLIKQGQVTFWFTEDVVNKWTCKRSSGGSYTNLYSDIAIETLLIIKYFYGLTFRSTQGFGESIIKLMGFDVQMPYYTTLCRRLKKLSIDLDAIPLEKHVHVVVDSTGLKVYGEGEWKVRKHGYSKRRTWRKLHLLLDEKNNQILAVELTGNNQADCEVLEDLLKKFEEGDIEKLSADGAYDTHDCYENIKNKGAQAIIPPRERAKINQHGNSKKEPMQRDENIRGIRKLGKANWKIESGYHRRSLAETAMFRFKNQFSQNLSSRIFKSQVQEAIIKTKILNKLATSRSC